MPNKKTIEQVHQRATCLAKPAEINDALDRMATEITRDLSNAMPLLLCVMIGGVIPIGQLATRLSFPLEIDYIHVTRYRGSTRGGDLHWLVEPRQSLKDRVVLIIEDVLDGGYTLAAIVDYCKQQGAKAVYTSVVVDKAVKREADALQDADYVGLTLGDHYIYGFGLDYHEYLRNVAGIYAIAQEDQ